MDNDKNILGIGVWATQDGFSYDGYGLLSPKSMSGQPSKVFDGRPFRERGWDLAFSCHFFGKNNKYITLFMNIPCVDHIRQGNGYRNGHFGVALSFYLDNNKLNDENNYIILNEITEVIKKKYLNDRNQIKKEFFEGFFKDPILNTLSHRFISDEIFDLRNITIKVLQVPDSKIWRDVTRTPYILNASSIHSVDILRLIKPSGKKSISAIPVLDYTIHNNILSKITSPVFPAPSGEKNNRPDNPSRQNDKIIKSLNKTIDILRHENKYLQSKVKTVEKVVHSKFTINNMAKFVCLPVIILSWITAAYFAVKSSQKPEIITKDCKILIPEPPVRTKTNEQTVVGKKHRTNSTPKKEDILKNKNSKNKPVSISPKVDTEYNRDKK